MIKIGVLCDKNRGFVGNVSSVSFMTIKQYNQYNQCRNTDKFKMNERKSFLISSSIVDVV